MNKIQIKSNKFKNKKNKFKIQNKQYIKKYNKVVK